MTIQKDIDDHLEGFVEAGASDADSDNSTPLGTIVLENADGSFDLPEDVRLTLIKPSNVTCNSNEGNNHLSVSGGDQIEISSFKDGILRLDKVSKVSKLTVEKNAIVHVADAEIQELDITESEVTLSNCKLMGEAKFTRCEVRSAKNEYQSDFEITGGVFTSDQDSFQSELKSSDQAVITLSKPDFQDKLTVEECVVTLGKAKVQGEVECTDSRLIDDGGEYQDKLTVSGSASSVVLRDSKLQGKIEFSDGGLIATGGEFEDEASFTSACVNLSDCEFKDKLTAEKCTVLIKDGKVSKEAEFTKSATRAHKVEFEDKVTVDKGAWQSEKCKLKDDFEATGTTVESVKDEFSGDIKMEDMIADSVLYKPDGAQKITLSGDGGASITVTESKCLELKCEDGIGRLEINGFDGEKLDLSSIGILRGRQNKSMELTIDACGFVQWAEDETEKLKCTDTSTLFYTDGKTQIGEISDCGSVHLDNSEITAPKIENCGFVNGAGADLKAGMCKQITLLVTGGATGLIVEDSGVIDNGSEMIIKDSNILATESTLMATGCLVNAKGGTIICDDEMSVFTTGATVMNPLGYTAGTGFTADLQGGCTLYGTGLLTLQASLGDVLIKSLLGSVTTEATMDIVEVAGMGISNNAGLAIINTALAGNIENFAAAGSFNIDSLDLTANIESAAAINAGTDVTISGGASVSLVSAGAVFVNGSLVNIN